MARTLVSFLLVTFLISMLFLQSIQAARPLNVGEDAYKFSDKYLSLGVMKNSGPSPGGKGHRFYVIDDIGGMKNSGPSPGKGHSFITGDHQ
ncbi:hypothetical protein FRX31_006918 [Thalictrum thalictroides]|uniref:Transmembrane protein n=1 Tax=Thalictrum thalictroides TaxID=46969 RepID=A0A7J6X335_THATH|nr:hypothetical protein FRX31_006918 [Thalictrum thalictroides]